MLNDRMSNGIDNQSYISDIIYSKEIYSSLFRIFYFTNGNKEKKVELLGNIWLLYSEQI